MVLYRKYRPKRFEDVVGQELVVQMLKNAVSQSRPFHAYLFSGPRGIGKTTVARIYAKALNCLTLGDPEPCEACVICNEFNNNQTLDLVEIDAASNRGIDEIRNLRESVGFVPLKSKYKIFIIDEAHMLTKEAFNAFLKTLEEPPEHAIFILATTEPTKLPATVLSRLQRFDFKRISREEIFKQLKTISEKEHIKIDDAALKLISQEARGSLRDALVLLDSAILNSRGAIDVALVERITGHPSFLKLKTFVDFLVKKDIKAAFLFLNKLYEEGLDVSNFISGLYHYLRKVMMVKQNPELLEHVKQDFSDSELSALEEHVQSLPIEFLSRFLKGLIAIEDDVKKVSIPLLPLEILLIESLK